MRPQGGLCNRLRALDSAILLSRAHNAKLKVVWECNDELNCDCRRLFTLPPEVELVVSNYERIPLFARRQYPLTAWEGSRLNRFVQKYLLPPLDRNHVLLNEFWNHRSTMDNSTIRGDLAKFDHSMCQWFEKRIENCEGDLYIASCYRYCASAEEYSWLAPAEEIQKSVSEFVANMNSEGPLIGLHVRRTDQQASIEHSPLSLFEKAIERELLEDQQTVFFLATDDAETKVTLVDKFGESKIKTRESVLRRDSPEGIVDAMVELMLLSRTSKIYGSFWSTFSETASSLGGSELIVIDGN